jgi:aminopeptidase N
MNRNLNDIEGYNWRQTDFHETPSIPTYLIAITISDFKCARTRAYPLISKNVSIGICGIPSRLDEYKHALNISARTVEIFESIFNTEFYFAKHGYY